MLTTTLTLMSLVDLFVAIASDADTQYASQMLAPIIKMITFVSFAQNYINVIIQWKFAIILGMRGFSGHSPPTKGNRIIRHHIYVLVIAVHSQHSAALS